MESRAPSEVSRGPQGTDFPHKGQRRDFAENDTDVAENDTDFAENYMILQKMTLISQKMKFWVCIIFLPHDI